MGVLKIGIKTRSNKRVLPCIYVAAAIAAAAAADADAASASWKGEVVKDRWEMPERYSMVAIETDARKINHTRRSVRGYWKERSHGSNLSGGTFEERHYRNWGQTKYVGITGWDKSMSSSSLT
ncbi:hypothetical protein HZH66_014888 [Vespula vulgaris]|uniref:Uncharacterized protein n=1 Tax=Vespula vulgaris TaxID=7454 RepID=A0A834MN74_VESVU|nr:hypothetical protein HZH66_014888 [Vespula vulgaris]